MCHHSVTSLFHRVRTRSLRYLLIIRFGGGVKILEFGKYSKKLRLSRRVTTSRISRISLKAICLTYVYLILIMSSSYIFVCSHKTLYILTATIHCVIHPLRENGFRAENKMIQKSKGRVVAGNHFSVVTLHKHTRKNSSSSF